MKILIQQARIIDANSPYHNSTQDILVENGRITEISAQLNNSADKTIASDQLCVSPGWVDVFSNFGDPGYEFKETLETGAAAAAAGGYTDVFVIPNTKPVVDSKAQVEYIRGKSASGPVSVYPIGAITKNAEGKDLSEMYDMHASGAIAFSDGLHPLQSAGVLLKALQYLKAVHGIVIQIPDDRSIGTHGLMHEGVVSTTLGLPGKPMMAEEILVARDIKLVRYTGSRFHFSGITSPKSREYIRRAKESGLDITCSVTPYHLFFSDEDLMHYDTNLKVYPPLRTPSDRQFLRDAVLDGTIDCIASHHMPHEYDSKIVEFEYAKFGMTGLETTFAALQTALPQLSLDRCIELLSTNPRKIFGLPPVSMNIGAEARITLFNPEAQQQVDPKTFKSRSVNSAFTGLDLKGRIIGIINSDKVFLTHQ